MRNRTTHHHWLRAGRHGRGQLALTLVLASLAVALLLGGCGSGSGGGSSSAANSQASSGVATTWKAQDASSASSGGPLYSVSFVDDAHGWAVGFVSNADSTHAPLILATSNGGATWKAQDGSRAGSDVQLYGVDFVDATRGWAVGTGFNVGVFLPVILVTSDGGGTWTAQDASSAGSGGAMLISVAFADAEHGWVVGQGASSGLSVSLILATSDGGFTWKAQDPSSAATGAKLNSVSFIDAKHGWVVGAVETTDASDGKLSYTPVILATRDGGAIWKAQDSSSAVTGAKLNSVSFVDAKHGWAVGTDANYGPVILATTDGGANWKAQDATPAGSDVRLLSVAFVDAKHGWAVGSGTYGGIILATSDGGTIWKTQDAGPVDSVPFLSSVTFVDAAHGWAAAFGHSSGAWPVVLATGK